MPQAVPGQGSYAADASGPTRAVAVTSGAPAELPTAKRCRCEMAENRSEAPYRMRSCVYEVPPSRLASPPGLG